MWSAAATTQIPFIKDYHNIRGKTSSSSPCSASTAGAKSGSSGGGATSSSSSRSSFVACWSGQLTLDGGTALGGAIPVNTSGGLKARGHPPGATGVAQAVEIVQQLRGTASERQVKGATLGLMENHGGTGATAVVHLLEAN